MLCLVHLNSMFQKNNKFFFYTRNYFRQLYPRWIFQMQIEKKLGKLENYDQKYLWERVDYYNKLNSLTGVGGDALPLGAFKYGIKPKAYFFDSYELLRYFSSNLKVNYLFGDITHSPSRPAFVKSRPVGENNENSVILKLNKVRHFLFVSDKKKFEEKKNQLVGRAKVYQKSREDFLRKYFGHPICDVGKVNNDRGSNEWLVNKMSINEHLEYKFILCLEGNDVASNLKWVMSSNSIAVMPKPKYETWFMEGKLKGGVHYIEIGDDFSDLEEKLRYYIEHTGEAEQIVRNAHQHVAQFRNKEREKLISFLTVLKYFDKTRQDIGKLKSYLAFNNAMAPNSDML
jgi:hypothetical protein